MINLKKDIEKIFKTSWYPMIDGRSNFNAPKAEEQLLTLFSEVTDEIIGEDEQIRGSQTADTQELISERNLFREKQRARKKEFIQKGVGE